MPSNEEPISRQMGEKIRYGQRKSMTKQIFKLRNDAGTIENVELNSLPSPPSDTIPSGLIVMWSGLKANIPTGWLLCDGNLGTPDLQDRFILGVGAAEESGGIGGATTLSHAGAAVAEHAALSHSVTQPAQHAALAHSGTAVAEHAALTHTGAAVNAHDGLGKGGTSGSAIYFSTPTMHTVTQPAQHAAQNHTVTQPNDHATQTHTGTAVDQHAAQNHSVTQPNDHADTRPPYFKLCFIMKA